MTHRFQYILLLCCTVTIAGCGKSMPVDTAYDYYASFLAEPGDEVDIYVGKTHFGRAPFLISAERLASVVNREYGLDIKPLRNEFFVSHGYKNIGGTFENGPDYLYLDHYPDRMFTITVHGRKAPVRITGVLTGKLPRPQEYRFTIRPILGK